MAVKLTEIGLAVLCVLFYLLWFRKKWPVCQYLFFIFATPLVSDIYVILGLVAFLLLESEEKVKPTNEREQVAHEFVKLVAETVYVVCVVMVFGKLAEAFL